MQNPENEYGRVPGTSPKPILPEEVESYVTQRIVMFYEALIARGQIPAIAAECPTANPSPPIDPLAP